MYRKLSLTVTDVKEGILRGAVLLVRDDLGVVRPHIDGSVLKGVRAFWGFARCVRDLAVAAPVSQ